MLLVSTHALPGESAGASKTLDARGGPRILEASIIRLQKEFADVEDVESTTEKRRTCKNVIRRGTSLLEEYPESPNRFLVLSIVFENRQILFGLDDSDQNREALLETCRALAEAPAEYAGTRLGADVLLTQIELVQGDASSTEAAEAITELVSRYKGTPVEADSLMIASMIANDMGDCELLKTFRDALSERFADAPTVKTFLRERLSVSLRKKNAIQISRKLLLILPWPARWSQV